MAAAQKKTKKKAAKKTTKKRVTKKKTTKKKRAPRTKRYLLFIDTNVFLDFYRVRAESDASMELLGHLPDVHDKIITTSQVEMEFKSNRQATILDAFSKMNLKPPEVQGVPPILFESTEKKMIDKTKDEFKKRREKLEKRVHDIFENPKNDPVWKAAQGLFRSGGKYHLMRDNDDRFEIRELAYKRFSLGYPPRKPDDLAYGDAINWEWIFECAKRSGWHVVIVSRDTDFGCKQGSGKKAEYFINDWLLEEFRERLESPLRELILTPRLAEGLKYVQVKVTEQEEAAEEELLTRSSSWSSSSALAAATLASLQEPASLRALRNVITHSPAAEIQRMIENSPAEVMRRVIEQSPQGMIRKIMRDLNIDVDDD